MTDPLKLRSELLDLAEQRWKEASAEKSHQAFLLKVAEFSGIISAVEHIRKATS